MTAGRKRAKANVAAAGTAARTRKTAQPRKTAAAPAPAAEKKLGLESSSTRTALVEATDRLIREQGFAAITSRIIAAEAGLKPQLIHYYFNSMDDLYVEVFRRGAEADLKRLTAALEAEKPLHVMWRISTDPKSARFATEFITIANHIPAVRAEISHVAARRRDLQTEIISRHLAARGVKPRIPPVVTAMLIENVARGRLLESALGLTKGHAEMDAFVEACLRLLDEHGDVSDEAFGLLSQASGAGGHTQS